MFDLSLIIKSNQNETDKVRRKQNRWNSAQVTHLSNWEGERKLTQKSRYLLCWCISKKAWSNLIDCTSPPSLHSESPSDWNSSCSSYSYARSVSPLKTDFFSIRAGFSLNQQVDGNTQGESVEFVRMVWKEKTLAGIRKQSCKHTSTQVDTSILDKH